MYYLNGVLFLVLFTRVNCGVLLWSSKQFRLPALKVLTDVDLEALKSYLDGPTVVLLKGDPNEYENKLVEIMLDKYTAYVPTEDLSLGGDNLIDLNAGSLIDVINQLEGDDNVLYVVVNESVKRSRRDVENDVGNENNSETASSPVWYNADGKAMIYSSKPPLLRINATNLILGRAVLATIDSRGTYSRLNVVVTYEGRKITLRFKFVWSGSGYWTLKSVKIEDDENNDSYTLHALTSLTASRNFSYHCTGEILFSNEKNDIDLILYDMQAQPDSLNNIFGAAYDCISFTTVPIWSGIFVTLILLVGLAFGLGAMDSIKTMDRFDNAKTKPLTISVGE